MIPGPNTDKPSAVHLFILYRNAGCDRARARTLVLAQLAETGEQR